jgi:hypothetical protein
MKVSRKAVWTAARTLSESVEGVPNRDDGIVGKVLKAIFVQRPSGEFRKICVRKGEFADSFGRAAVVDRNCKEAKSTRKTLKQNRYPPRCSNERDVMKLSARRGGAGLSITVIAREPFFWGVLGEEGTEYKR